MRSRIFLPLFIVSIVAIGFAGYWSLTTIEAQQEDIANAQAWEVSRYLDQASRTLKSVAIAAESAPRDANSQILESNWRAYEYFDTLYYLDESSRIKVMVPSNPRYLGLDMSSMPNFIQGEISEEVTISPPFISLRTGYPTVYIIYYLQDGNAVVGELSLLSLQNEIAGAIGEDESHFVFILDQFGNLIAHPSLTLVREQANLGELELFRQRDTGRQSLIYDYSDMKVIGSASLVEGVDWLVINQIPLSTALSPYIWSLAILFGASLLLWFLLSLEIRRQIEHKVISPLVNLSRGTGALSHGDFSHAHELATFDTTFSELDQLADDFRSMSTALRERQSELKESEKRYRALYEENPTMYFTLDSSGKILSINRFGAEQLGYGVEELVGSSIVDLFHPADRTFFKRYLKDCASQVGDVSKWELRKVRKDGTIFWVKEMAHVVKDTGESATILIVCEDISARKQAEEEINAKNLELQAAYQQMTANSEKLVHNYEELERSQGALEQARRKLNMLNSVTFNDIKNAIFSLSGYLELEEMKPDEQKDMDYLDREIALVKSIEDTLTFARQYQDLGIKPPHWQNVKQAFLMGISHLDTS